LEYARKRRRRIFKENLQGQKAPVELLPDKADSKIYEKDA